MLLGHWIEMRSVMGASAALESLVRLMPSDAHRIRADGSAEEVPVVDHHPDDRVVVKPDEKIPIDGVIVEGRTSVNEAMLTGESKPVERQAGIQVMMITGDARPVAAWVARELELDDYFAEVLPDQKADNVKEEQQRGLIVAMTGDGVNDAPPPR